MGKSKLVYVWTNKAEAYSNGRCKAGTPATWNGHTITDKDVEKVKSWFKFGFVIGVDRGV